MSQQFDVSLSFASSNRGDDYWELEINDPLSALPILRVKMNAEDFARLVGTSEYQRSLSGNLYRANADRWGQRLETDRVVVPGLNYKSWDDRQRLVDAAMEPLRADGWELRSPIEERVNSHRLSDAGYSFSIRRWVEA